MIRRRILSVLKQQEEMTQEHDDILTAIVTRDCGAKQWFCEQQLEKDFDVTMILTETREKMILTRNKTRFWGAGYNRKAGGKGWWWSVLGWWYNDDNDDDDDLMTIWLTETMYLLLGAKATQLIPYLWPGNSATHDLSCRKTGIKNREKNDWEIKEEFATEGFDRVSNEHAEEEEGKDFVGAEHYEGGALWRKVWVEAKLRGSHNEEQEITCHRWSHDGGDDQHLRISDLNIPDSDRRKVSTFARDEISPVLWPEIK